MKATKCLFCAVTTAMAIVAPVIAEDASAVSSKKPPVMTPELRAKLKTASLRASGGRIRKEGSARGWLVYLNVQKKVDAKDLQRAIGIIDKSVKVQVKMETLASVNLVNPKDDIAKAGGTIGVVIVEDANLPALLTAPEEGWAIINVTKLADACDDAAKLASRVRKEMLRAFGLVGGCAFMGRGQMVLTNIATPVELDEMRFEDFGIDAQNALANSLPARGVMPWIEATYRKACKEGWAPTPTNEYQKVIWDKVHELPTKPIKIEFDPKTDTK